MFRGPLFNLQFNRWSRLAHAEATRLPALVDVEVHDIPAHAWDRSTTEYLLRDSCLITDIHPSTTLKNELSSFRLRAWCSNLDMFPLTMKLLIVEPGTDVQERRCLSYDIKVVVTDEVVPMKLDPPPPQSSSANGRDRHEDGGGRHSDDPHSQHTGCRPRHQRPILQRLDPRRQSTIGGRGVSFQRATVPVAGPVVGVEEVASPPRQLEGSPLLLTTGIGAKDYVVGVEEVPSPLRQLECPPLLLTTGTGAEDGFTGRCYKCAWTVVKRDFLAALSVILQGGSSKLYLLNSAYVTLLPKKAEAVEVKDFRPISLINSFAKIITKILANRLTEILPKLVSPNQSAFIKGRSIHDNFMMVRETAKAIHRQKISRILLKLDIGKAFDSVSWHFLLEVLEHVVFGLLWRNLIAKLLCSSSTRVLVNGEPGDLICHQQGLQQGDPLSPNALYISDGCAELSFLESK
jgi:hypothetical protein